MSDLISREPLYKRAVDLEAQALDYVVKLNEREPDKYSEEWKIWSAILVERTAFKHDVADAPTIEERKKGEWIKAEKHYYKDDDQHFYYYEFRCSECGAMRKIGWTGANFCPNCGADMRGEVDGL